MDRMEAKMLIELIGGLERRTFPDSAADAWAFVLGDVLINDALKAVREHAGTSNKALTPAMVRHRALEIQAARERARARRPRASASPAVREAALAAMRAEAARAVMAVAS